MRIRNVIRQSPTLGNIARGTILLLWFAKGMADFEINDLAALPPMFRYNSSPCLNYWPVPRNAGSPLARVGASYSRIWRYVNNSAS
jgi:hypothetical protein